jgi:hypothetical protein
MNRLEVKTSKVTLVCAVLLGLIIVPLALGIFIKQSQEAAWSHPCS